MKPGRNDPCPCGSGKKYKHCCLDAGTVPANAPPDPALRRLRALLQPFVNDILRFTTETYGPLAVHEAWYAFVDNKDVELDPEAPLMQLFMPWLFNCWSPDPLATLIANKTLHGVIPTRAYLTAKGRRLDPLLRRYLESLLTAPFSFFEVLTCRPGTGMTLRDVMTKEEHAVIESGASRKLQPGDLLFGQLGTADDVTLLEASNAFAISPMEKAPIVELRARIAAAHPAITHQVLRDWDFELLDLFHEIADRAFNPPQPILLNTDGEPISPHKLVFDLKVPPQAAFDALKHLALDHTDEDLLEDATRDAEGGLTGVFFRWKKLGNAKHPEWDNTVLGSIRIDGTRLVVEVNSQARAGTIRKHVETALGDDVRYLTSEIQTAEKVLAEIRAGTSGSGTTAAEEHARLAEYPEVQEKLSEMLAGHWERWVDTPLPMLGNRTPMEAVKEPDGREIVESLVIQAERRGGGMHVPTPDEEIFHRLRERLGLAESPVQSTKRASAGR